MNNVGLVFLMDYCISTIADKETNPSLFIFHS